MLVAAFFLPVCISAQTDSFISESEQGSGDFMKEYEIFFRFDKTTIDVNYLNNTENLASIRHYLANAHRVDSITIYSYASPEGRQKHNQWLSQERARAAKAFLLKHSPDSAVLCSDMIRICPLSENWPGLIKEVEKRYHRHDRARVLRILNNKNISDDTRKWRLGRLDGGYTWSFLRRIYMPELRVATWVCVYGDIVPPLPRITQAPFRLSAPCTQLSFLTGGGSIAVEQSLPPVHKRLPREKNTVLGQSGQMDKSTRTILGLKTNLLLDAVSALNYAIEVPVNEHVSLEYFQTAPWWTGKKNNFCLQFLSFGGQAKWWFLPRTRPSSENRKQRDALVGHFLGVYGWGGKGDIQLGRKVCHQFDFWSAGLTYGYALPVSRNLNMEFTLSVGYASIPYQHYVPTDDFSLLVRDPDLAGTLHYIGPTKAEVSLVIPIRATVGKKGGKK